MTLRGLFDRLFGRAAARREGAEEALGLLAIKFGREGEACRRKCKRAHAEYYASLAAEMRNHVQWVLERVGDGSRGR